MEELNSALLFVYDLFSRDPGLAFDYVMVGEGARCLKENRGLDCDRLEFVAPQKRATPEVLSMLRVWASPVADRDGCRWMVGKVPATLTFLKGEYDHFKYADQRVYGPEFYKIPNNWKDYWENRDNFV